MTDESESDIESAAPSVWDLRGISTQWSVVTDANTFVLRYVDAIERYLQILLRDENDVEEVLQQFLLKILEKGFERLSPDRGRFRHYLIRAVRNEVITWQRKQKRRPAVSLEKHDDVADATNQAWDAQWQACMLDRGWKYLRQHEVEHPGNYCYTVLQMATANDGGRSEELAERASKLIGHELNAAAFRKQLSRARRQFAEYLVQEVTETIEHPTPESIVSELRELGLMPFIEKHLPESWKS